MDRIDFLPSSENPLSADVYLIRGDEYTYVVDVGSSDGAYALIQEIDKKKVIITHFHDDHMKNLSRLEIAKEDLFIGEHTQKVLRIPAYNKEGTVVTAPITITDGVSITIWPVPSSHAKGSLGVTVDNEYLLIGDGYYCSSKGYNVSLLHDEIKTLKGMSFTKVIKSHDEKIYDRDEVIAELENIYARNEKGNPYINI